MYKEESTVCDTFLSCSPAAVCNVEVAPCSLSSMSAGPPTTPTQALAQTLQISIMKYDTIILISICIFTVDLENGTIWQL